MNILNPYVILGFVLALIGAFFTGHHKGYAEAQAEQQIEVARLNTLAREVEHVMTGKVNDLSTKLQKANSDAKVEIVKRNISIADGTLRLSVPTRSVCPTADSPASSNNTEARTELEPAFAQSLIAITDEGDEAIRKLNACIDAYNIIQMKVEK
jgi:prophage endopeptidase